MAKKLICPLMSEKRDHQECLETDCAWFVLIERRENPITGLKEKIGYCAVKRPLK